MDLNTKYIGGGQFAVVTKPFAGYTDFDDCVRKNGDQANPEAYCATIMRQAEKQEDEEPAATRGMVAFYPSPAIAQALASYAEDVPNAESAEDYHITLAYFPEIEPDERDALLQAVAHVAFMFPSPVTTSIEGLARFLPSEGSDGLVPQVALVDPRNLEDIRETICAFAGEVVEIANNHGFVPHITLAYTDQGTSTDIALPPALPLQFSELTLMLGDERHDFPLGGMMPTTARPMYMSLLREKVAEYEIDDDDSARPPLASHPTVGTMSNLSTEKAVWTTASINDLPDSSFLYIEPGGKKVDGRTEPRSLRHFPVKDGDGAIDLPHLRNAISRLPQSNAPGLTPEKVAALQDRARGMLEEASKSSEKSGKRISAHWRERLGSVMESLRAMMQWADYEDDDGKKPDEEDMEDMMKAVGESGSAFVVFKDAHGLDRWLSFSSNGFRDREAEIVSTKALEDAVDAADLSGKRGPLRLWHTAGADIGETDFQAVQGRFLIESGSFFDDEASRRAKEYFTTTDEPLGISIGFIYPESDFDGQVYKTIRFLERSVCPHWAVANPFTLFATLGKGEDDMNQTKAAWLSEVVGSDLAGQMLKTADAATKELEQRVAFKAEEEAKEPPKEEAPKEEAPKEESKDPLLDALTAVKSALPDLPEVTEAFGTFVKVLDEATKAPPEEKAPEAPDFVATLKDLLAPIAAAVGGMDQRMKDVEDRLAANEAREKELASNTPRGAGVYRGTEGSDNVLDETKVKGLWGESSTSSPVKGYIEDIMHHVVGGSGA